MNKVKRISRNLFAVCLSALLVLQLSPFSLYSDFGAGTAAYADQATAEGAGVSSATGKGTSGEDAGTFISGNGASGGASGESAADVDAASSIGDASTANDIAAQGDAAADEGSSARVVAYKYTTAAELQDAIGASKVAISDGRVTSVIIETSDDLIKLSNAEPSLYQTASITKGSGTGESEFNLCRTTSDSLSFVGLGSETVPFKGAFSMDGKAVILNGPLFNGVELSADMKLDITWKGTTSDPIVATTIAGNGHALTANVAVAPSTDTSSDITLTSPLLGTAADVLALNATYTVTGGVIPSVSITSSTGNIGLLANTVDVGASFTIESLALPAGYNGTPTVQTTKSDASAGGLIGTCNNGATVTLKSAIDLSKFAVKGMAASGGLIGRATGLTLVQKEGAKFTCPATVGDAASQSSGGFIGDVSFAAEVAFAGNDQIDTGAGVTLAAAADKGAGAVFGTLTYADSSKAVSFTDGAFKSAYGNGGSTASYGGLIGMIVGAAGSRTNKQAPSTLKVEGTSTELSIEGATKFAGGVAGWLGHTESAALELKNAQVIFTKVITPSNGIGGVVGCTDHYSVIDIDGVAVSTAEGTGSIDKGAGIAAECWNSVIRLGGVTDFSNMSFAENDSVAQIALVRADEPTLVFARGTGSDSVPAADSSNDDYWVFKRCSATKIDDLGGAQDVAWGYGEVVRLDGKKLSKNLITVNSTTHKLEGPSGTDWRWQVGYDSKWADGNRTLTIKSTQDFACLVLSVQFDHLWNGVYGLDSNNKAQLLGPDAIINLEANVNLTGTGIGGLGFDTSNVASVFAGTLNGKGHTVTHAIGEPYGMRGDMAIATDDTTAGNGKIYRHNRLGLLSAVGGASINDLTIDGAMNFDNGAAVDAGTLAATLSGDATLSGVTCEAEITCDDTFGNDANIGGIAGSMTGAGTVLLDSNASNGAVAASKAQAIIKTGGTLNGATCIGGAVGYVGDVASTFNVASLEVGGSITAADCASGKIAQVGGLIGSIAQGTASNTTTINITGLSFDSFTMTVGKNGDAKNGAGGLLGYSWGNAIVTIGNGATDTSITTYALTVSSATVTANNATELGGLVYAASGHWIINDYAIDLSGAKLSAANATTIGVLVGRGSRVENSTTYGTETYTGLYLEDKAYWGTAYRVEGIGVAAPKVTSFDEWVGNGTKPGSKLIDGDWNTVVSLHTSSEKLDMSGIPGNDNSYKNRSDFGKAHNTNGSTRYFYNLDRAYAAVGGNGKTYGANNATQMETASELLLWCAYRYAPPNIRSMIVPAKMKTVKDGICDDVIIGGENTSTIDLSGYSYYPTQPSGNVTVKNAAITFHYSGIKDEQSSNKLNSEATQHENMHCGLLRTVGNGNLTVNTVTLSGTIGPVVNDGRSSSDISGAGGSASGALVCRYVYGNSNKVGKIEIDGVTLDGLAVDGVTDGSDQYAPLLINEMQTYVSLDVKNVTATGYSDKVKAASSLFGKLGVGSTADQVTASFSMIGVSSLKDSTIFTRASLLESFGYGDGKTGSAIYTFYKADENAGKVTYGAEIDSNGEYHGSQFWYYDENLNGTDGGLVTVGNVKADKDNPRFSGYLPYVRKGQVNESNVQYHEIKVNQRVPKLTVGCGTYGDPYAITKASELNAVAEYINTNVAADGWEVTIAKDQTELCRRRSESGSTDNEVTYVYKQANAASKKWEKKTGESKTDPNTTLDDTTMHSYLQSAYYSIEPKDSEGNAPTTLTLDTASFQGLGNKGNPFRGVIVGNLGGSERATIEIDNPSTSTGSSNALAGLIPYSYGSVVSNLTIEYTGATASIAYKSKDGDGVPGAFFGGVIGCVLGGDNIIDGVSVNASDGFKVVGAGTKPHLVPVGGYVGAITGGGVLFRNSANVGGALNSWHDAAHGDCATRYDNPYVGRVIDGYAFSELPEGESLNNTDRNYKVNNLVEHKDGDAQCIVTGNTCGLFRGDDEKKKGKNPGELAITTTVNDAQGLLVLSAIISSGAGGGSANSKTAGDNHGNAAGSRAYWGINASSANAAYQFGNQSYGKVRNAEYTAVGKPGDAAAEKDFAKATSDDRKSPGYQVASSYSALDCSEGSQVNSPYLVAKYATWQTGNICVTKASGMDLQFKAGETFDMTPYGTGYTGLSGRYYSNACASDKGADRDRIVPLVATINGNGATIKVGSKGSSEDGSQLYAIKEYVDDDYKLTGVGAMFGTVTYTSANVSGSINANDGYTVRDLNFSECNIRFMYTDTVGNEVSAPSGTEVGVGLLAGTTANNNSLANYGKYSGITMTNCVVEGPTDVGGLIGASGYGSRTTNKNDKTWIVNRNDTSSTDNRYSPVKLYNCSYNGMTVSGGQNVGGFVGKLNGGSQGGVWTTADADIAQNSTIVSDGSRVGGVFGVTGDAVFVNVDPATKQPTAESGKATITGVTLSVPATAGKDGGVGGLIGKVENNLYVRNLTVTGGKNVKVFGADNATTFMNVGGIAGNITDGGEFTFDTCEVSNVSLQAREVSGGISGRISGSPTVTCNNVTVNDVTFGSSYAGGINGSIGGSPTFSITNTKIANNVFENPSNNWEGANNQKSRSGGLCGDGKGVFRLSNVLIDSNNFRGKNGQGIFFGDAKDKSSLQVYAAGIDIKPGAGKTRDGLPPLMLDTTADQSNVKGVNTVSYIAFGDYSDTLAAPDTGTTLYSDETNADGTPKATEALSPYVTTSPASDVAVRASATDGTDRHLFGDGVNVDTATTIKNEAGTNAAGRYTYNNIGGTDSNGNYQNTKNTTTYSEASVGSFNDNNSSNASGGGEGAPKQAADDFNVLVLSGGDADTVKDYLNIVTNGGYSDALRVNGDGSHVKATVDVFQLDSDKGNFVKQSDVADKALEVKGEGSSLSVDANGLKFDNGKGRFNLLTVTFTEAGQSYKVQVPIIVKRMLEINFTATYSEGSNFKSADYASKYDKHVLISSGETMTGYLTWTYNQMYSTPTQYGWNTHLASGGSMRPLAKQIAFGGGAAGALPENTQLTLVDTAHNDKAYHYTVPTGGCASVALTSFVDADGKSYVEQWLSETMGITATKASDGAWVKLSDDEMKDKTESDLINAAGVKIGSDYYRVKTSADTAGPFYSLTVPNENPQSESFYLVVRTPNDSAKVNGFTATSVTASMPTHLNYTLRKDETIDNHENTASTYSIASNYRHNLVDEKKQATTQVGATDAADSLAMNVSDTITFGAQEYTGADTLYYQLDSSLVDYEGGIAASAHGYPTGTNGTYSFYVKVGDIYYTWSRKVTANGDGTTTTKWTWEPSGTTEAAVVTTADGKPLGWTSTGGDMSLVLADAGGAPIDLSGIRSIAKDNDSQFTIIMKANLMMSSQACQAGIIASQDNGSDKYTKPNYRAYLSPHAGTLTSSSNSDYNAGNVGYYRQGTGSSTIELKASERKQLGINVDDLKPADGTIALTGTYDFDEISGADAKISKGDTVTYTLSLQQRQNDGSYAFVRDISSYIPTAPSSKQLGTATLSDGGSSYTFTDAKTNGGFATRDANKPAAFNLGFSVKVNTDVEGEGQTYANYRLVLTAQLSSGGEVIDTPVNVNNLAAYANSDYVTYTLSRINTGGIAHP